MLSTSLQICALCIGSIVAYVLGVCVYRLTFHPLARYPGPLCYKISGWSLVYQCYKGNRHLYGLRDHEKYGPIVRTSPNTLSFSTPTALHQIYGSRAANVRKSKFYESLDSGSGGSTTHTEIDKEKHAARRRILSPAFSDAALREAECFVVENVRKFVRLLGPSNDKLMERPSCEEVVEDAEENDGVWSVPRNMSDWCNWLAYDVMGNLVFGKSYNCLESEEHRRMPVLMTEGTKFGYWFAYLPIAGLLQPLETTLLMQWLCGQTARDNAQLVAYATSQFEERKGLEEKRRELKNDHSYNDLMHYLLNNADSKTGIRPTRAELEGDSLSLIGAGADTIATTLAAVLFYLARYSLTLQAAKSEVRRVFDRVEDIHSGPQMDSCIYMNACIEEALRLSPAVAAPLPREVMKGGIMIDGHHIPEGVVVGVPAYVVHHNKEAFPDPWSFRPERWVAGSDVHDTGVVSKADISRAREAMCPFSLGSRMCIGYKLAYIEMRIALATLLWLYDLEEVPGTKKSGGKDVEKGRERVDEYQLFDCFGADRDGPILRFRQPK